MPKPSVERVRQALEAQGCRIWGSGDHFRVVCPVHESHNSPTMSVAAGRQGAVLFCHAACDKRDILAALGLTWDDLFDQPRDETRPRTPDRPVTEGERAVQGIMRAVRIANMATDMEGVSPMPDAEKTLGFAEAEEAEEAWAHWLKVRARHAALARDEKYVKEANATPPGRRSHEQSAVLATWREDNERERS